MNTEITEKDLEKMSIEEVIHLPDDTDPFLTVLDAYVTLYNSTNDQQIKTDANKLLASILPKL